MIDAAAAGLELRGIAADADLSCGRRARRDRRAAARRRGSRSTRPERRLRPAARSPRPRGCRRRRSRLAPAAFAWCAFSWSGQSPRSTSAIEPSSEPGGSVPTGRSSSPGGPQRWRSTSFPSVPVIAPTSTSVWSALPHAVGAGSLFAPWNGMPCRKPGAPAAVTSSGWREDVRVRHRGNRDRVGRRAGRAGGADAEVVAVVARRDHRHDTCCREVVHRLDERVVRRVDLRAAAGEVDDVHAVLHRRLEGGDDLRRVRDVADRRRHREDAVVAEPRPRCDAAQAGDRRMVGACGRRRARDARRDAGDVRAVERRVGIDGEAARRRPRSGPGTPSRRSPSASSTSRRPSGSRPGTRSRPG